MVVEKTTYRRVGTERLKQLDPRVRQLDEHNRYAMRRQCQRLRDTGAERAAVEPACGCEIGYHDRDMVEPPIIAAHRRSSVIPAGGGAIGLDAQALWRSTRSVMKRSIA